MITERITDPTDAIDAQQIETAFATGHGVTIQFSHDCYTPEQLREIDQLCQQHGSKIEVRFFAHDIEPFDASILSALPNVKWLTLGAMEEVRGIDTIARLPKLEQLSIDISALNDPAFIDSLPLEQLTRLSVAGNQKRNFDLATLARAQNLQDLFIQGHTKNIEIIGDLPNLASLGLSSMPNRQSLDFVNKIQGLKSLLLIIGGRTSIDDVQNETLEELRIIRVRGLDSLGDLARFHALRKLQVEDQLQLKALSLDGVDLHELTVLNCKNLAEITGLEDQRNLQLFRVGRTGLDLDGLANLSWPETITQLDLN
ncbi:hypothetical protein ATL17_1673 [Maritalea mobilis]|uniref:Leucine rich repeat (LRR) protein n=1 Tax=Maritalea mobilis TaxID=483324 RepID=A0A4R6VN88_9HYPH|nr:hypothetical protein [Maritalea mobilis]TDQ63666.1 hypothetical protein ATL17_1673 [Maritalea mobilis]